MATMIHGTVHGMIHIGLTMATPADSVTTTVQIIIMGGADRIITGIVHTMQGITILDTVQALVTVQIGIGTTTGQQWWL
jgi:hypothetical protein